MILRSAVFALGLVVFLSACESPKNFLHSEAKRLRKQRESAWVQHQAYRSSPNWRKATYRNDELLARATPANTSREIGLADQRGLLLVEGAIAMDFAVATGKKTHPTPQGHYTILEKKATYASNLYGKIYDSAGVVVNSDADLRSDPIPEGGKFVGSSMPFWMRLTNSGVGLHVGYVPGRPASHGCIRLQRATAKELFGLVRIGTPVTISETAPSLAQQEKRH